MIIHKALKHQLALGSRKGAAALLTIVIISAAVLIMAYSASLLGLGELELGYTSQKGEEAFALADGCMEEALRRLRLDNNYSGDTLNLDTGSCIISIVSNTITVTSTVGDFNKKLEATYTISSNVITITDWDELDD